VRSQRPRRHDRGFATAEVVVAMALLGVLLTAALAVLVRTTSVAGQNVRRTTAAALLARQLEVARGTRPGDIADGVTTTSALVGGTTYAIAQEARYVSSADGASLCDGTTGTLLYKLVTVRITWPEMQAVAPVRGDVLRATGTGIEGADAATGALAVLVTDSAGAPLGGIAVTLRPSGGSRVTDSSGCVVFVGLPPGRYAGDARSDDGALTGSSGGRDVTAGGITRTSITVTGPPPPPAPTPTITPDPEPSATVPPPEAPTTPGPGPSTPTNPFDGGIGTGEPGPSTPAATSDPAAPPTTSPPTPTPTPSPSKSKRPRQAT
jgi:type II secretory pathway pseudopilin PulG